MKHIAAAGNTVVPALLALEALGFRVELTPGTDSVCRATRGDESFVAGDPVTVLGLVRLVELRGWDWRASDRRPTPPCSAFRSAARSRFRIARLPYNVRWSWRAICGRGACGAAFYGIHPQLNFRR